MKRACHTGKDRLSDLPDTVILHILSFLNTKEALQTFVLSKRWKNIPKCLPILRLSSLLFKIPYSFENLLSQLLSFCDNSTTLHTVEFMESHDFVEPEILKSIVEHVVSRNVQTLRLSITCDIQEFPFCFFSSQTLTSLHLSVHHSIQHRLKILFPSSLNLPALTNLSLRNFYFSSGDDDNCCEPFSAFNKLDTLIIKHCRILKPQILHISSTTLVNLTMHGYYYNYKFVLSTPNLCNFAFSGIPNQKLFVSDPCSINHLYINDVNDTRRNNVTEDGLYLLIWLHQLTNIRSLTVSSNTLQVLSSLAPNLFNVGFTTLHHLESLRVEYSKPYVLIPDGVVDYLIQNSPLATVNIIPFED